MEEKPKRMEVIVENIPEELKTRRAWVLWKWVFRDGQLTKPPYQVNGADAKSNDPATWTDFETALAAYRNGGKWDGIGVELNGEYAGFDWDSCVSESGDIDPNALAEVQAINSYTEVSPSGTGLKTLVKAKLPGTGHHKKFDDIEIGVFDSGRYFCVTGNVLHDVSTGIEARQAQLENLIRRRWPDDFKPKPIPPQLPQRPIDLADQDIIEKALSANDGGKFRRLWDGCITDYASQSEADQAMCFKLAFWTGKDPQRIDTLFRQSGLYRDKWDRDDYRERTIERAIELTAEVYEPRNNEKTFTEEAPEPPEGAEKVANTLRPAILESEDFISKEMPEKIMYLDPWLSALSIILITGARGIGKSWFLLSLLLAITKFKSFGPWAPVTSAPCLYLDGEMAAQDAQERLVALDQDGVKQSPLYIYSDAYASSQGLPRANLLNPAWRKDMKSLLLDLGVKVWAVDNIASLTPGIDENSKQEWDPINQWLLELRFNEITTIPAHHTNRTGGQRGTSGREDNIDISILLKQPEGYTAEDGASFIVNFSKARVPTKHLPKLADTAFQMVLDKEGKTQWTWGMVKQERNKQIVNLFLEGVPHKDIAKELKCSIQNVYQVIKRHENRV